MTEADDRPEEFRPPTALESAVRDLGADTIRYRVDYVMLPMRDGIRLATVVFRPRAEGRYPTLLVRSPYAAAIPEQFKPMHKAQFEKDYVLIMQNERGSEWSEGDFGFLTKTTADAQDTLDWISAQDWSNGKVGLHGCSSTAENQLKLGAIGHPALRACVPMSSGAGVGDVPGVEGSKGCFFHGGVPMIKTWALWYAPFGVRLRPKLPAEAEGDELARIFRQYSVSVPDFRCPSTPRRWIRRRWRRRAGADAAADGLAADRLRDLHGRGAGQPGLGGRRPDRRQPHRRDAVDQHQRLDGHRRVRDREAVRVPAASSRPVPDHGADVALPDAGDRPGGPAGPAAHGRQPVPLRRDHHLLVRPVPAAMRQTPGSRCRRCRSS